MGAKTRRPLKKGTCCDSLGNLKQIGIAFHAYADSSVGNLPIDIRDKDGKALLSWRVAILPYIEENDLYKQFKLDEPWDSANNKKLIEKMPKIYAPVRVKAKEGETFYQVFTGEKAVFGPKKNPRMPESFPDGTSNTGLVFEAGDPVIWSKPADMVFDEKKAVPKLGGSVRRRVQRRPGRRVRRATPQEAEREGAEEAHHARRRPTAQPRDTRERREELAAADRDWEVSAEKFLRSPPAFI